MNYGLAASMIQEVHCDDCIISMSICLFLNCVLAWSNVVTITHSIRGWVIKKTPLHCFKKFTDKKSVNKALVNLFAFTLRGVP